MTASELTGYFDLLQDKYGSPYYTTAEKETFLNRAQLDVIESFFPQDGGEVNIELNQNTYNVLNPLIYVGNPPTVSSSGAVSKTTFESTMASSTGVAGAKVLRILSVAYLSKPVRWIRLNNLYTYYQNIFKVPSTTNYRYTEVGTTWLIRPAPATGSIIEFVVLRYPKSISVSGSQSSELPDIIHNSIISRALELAGVGSRDQMLSELQKLNNV